MVSDSVKKTAVRIERIGPGHAGQRVDNFLAGKLVGAPRSLIYKIIRTGQVRVNGGRVKVSTRLADGDQVRIPPVHVEQRPEKRVPAAMLETLAMAIIHEDGDLLVINKPSGLAVHGGSGVSWGVIDVVRQMRPGLELELVHRLDRETSGCLLLAKNKQTMRELQRQFRQGEPEKRYLCLMTGRMPQARILVDQPLMKTERGGERFMTVDDRGKPAQTEFRLLEYTAGSSFVEAFLLTGRTHQIRAHAAHMGLPLAGDTRYGTAAQARHWQGLGLDRLFLHAHRLAIRAQDGSPLQFTCALPAELRAVLDRI